MLCCAHSARMGPSCRYLAVALALFVALDPGLGGAPLPSKPTCRHGTLGQDLLVLRETLRGGRPSRDSARGSEEIRCAAPSIHDAVAAVAAHVFARESDAKEREREPCHGFYCAPEDARGAFRIPSPDQRGAAIDRHMGARTQSPSARERMKAFGATPSKRNVTEERAEMVQRLIEVCHSPPITSHKHTPCCFSPSPCTSCILQSSSK